MEPKVYLVGGSGTGKSTLAQHISTRFSLPMITGATSRACQTLQGRPDEKRGDIDWLDSYQKEVWHEQLASEKPFWENGQGFVSDRAFDLMAYTARISRVLWQVVRSPDFAEYVGRMRRDGSVIVFFCRPNDHVKVAHDGRRDFFLAPSWRFGVDSVIEFILESYEIPYINLEFTNLKDRIRTADAVMSLARRI